ncbi:hypothetical protein C2G38_2038017 [Gigaspora rosea]|uniref:Peptidase S1 domain-containing protein n=1 Tax=Gigaspora rosea TaxID=44941 RepID=A0A397VCS4_9GLOM|nr:hypothetical protein C2G38_2038017 [Gigaspora rosea]
MQVIYILTKLLLFIFSLQYFLIIYASQNEPLAKLWNINDDEILKYLEIEKRLTTADEILKQLLNDSNFSGTYINITMNLIFINTLNFSAADEIKNSPEMAPYKDLLSFKESRNSLAKLKHSFLWITKIANYHKPVNIVAIFLDMKLNNVVITLHHKYDRTNTVFLMSIKKYHPILEYSGSSNSANSNIIGPKSKYNVRTNDIHILAGDGLYNYAVYVTCSAGFWAKDNVNIVYIVTAGHCFSPGNYFLQPWNATVTNYIIGPMTNHKIGPLDFGLIHIVNKTIVPRPFIRNSNSKQNVELFIRDDIAVSSHGAHICKSGRTTHVTCGNVRAFGGMIIIKRYIMTVSDTPSMAGDSGGPAFSYKDLQYVSLFGISSSKAAKEITLFQPLNDILTTANIKLVVA